MPFAQSNGIRLHYQTAGSGDPVLLIMGLSGKGEAWRFQHPVLSQHHQVAWFDNRGVGQSDAPVGSYPIEEMARDALGLMDHLGWPVAHIVGVSMGGMIGQRLALLAPERVRSLALIATSPGGRRHLLTGPGHLRDLLGAASTDDTRRLEAMKRLLFPRAFVEQDPDFVQEVLRLDYGDPGRKHGKQGQIRGVLRHEARPHLDRIRAPTLVVQPGLDRMIRPRASERLVDGIPGAQLLTFPDAGHGVIRQNRDEVSDRLLAHFAAH